MGKEGVWVGCTGGGGAGEMGTDGVWVGRGGYVLAECDMQSEQTGKQLG